MQSSFINLQQLGTLLDIILLPGKVLGLVNPGNGFSHPVHDFRFFYRIRAGIFEGNFQLKEDEVLFIFLDKLGESPCTHLIDITVGIFFIRNQNQLYIQPFFQGKIQSPQCRFNTGRVPVINNREVIGILPDQP